MTAAAKKPICLAVLLHGGRFSWKYDGAIAEGDLDLEMYKSLARTAERGCLDVIFLADGYSTKDDGLAPDALRSLSTVVHFEPLTLLGVLSTVTQHIGLVCTASTTYNQPYDLARRMATLDHMSGGRAGWNLITSQMPSEALNFGYDAPLSNEDRYARAREFLEVTLKLWDSWDDDAFPRDKSTGAYLDPAKMHRLDHRGRFFQVRGPLNISRMPQGYPLLCQAGESEAGRELAAEYADMMYGKANDLAHGQAFYGPMKARMAKFGRAPDALKIMPGLCCVVGATREEAWAKFDRVQNTITPTEARAYAVQFMGAAFDLPGDPLAPIPDTAELNAIAARKRIGLAREGERLSLVGLGRWIAACMGHLTLVGTAAEIADTMERFVDEQGSDGFALMPHYLPGGLDDFVAHMVPELQRRGRLRTAYPEGTLRDILGLARPPVRRAAPQIPLLDLDRATPAELLAALQSSSCLFVTGALVSAARAPEIRAAAEAFFHLPEVLRQAVAWSGRGAWQGWQRMQAESDADRPDADLVERFARWSESFALWPDQPAGFRDIWMRHYAAMHRLASRVLAMSTEALGMAPTADTLHDWTTRQWSNLVVNHYPPQLAAPEAGRMRSRPHTDIGGLTILWTDDRTGGLEARIGGDGGWVPVHIPPGALLVQAGDLLRRWTGGRIPANLHRVVNPAPGSEAAAAGRFSVVYFHHPDMETAIGGEDGAPLIAGEHVRRRQRLETPVVA